MFTLRDGKVVGAVAPLTALTGTWLFVVRESAALSWFLAKCFSRWCG